MTQIDFYTNVSDKLLTACRIVAKGSALGHKILAFCPDANTAQHLDRLLWTTPPTGFVPHCSPGDALAPFTPVIVDYRGEEPVHDQVLLNLRDEWPAFFGRFERLIEIVSVDADDRLRARERYKFYRDRGYDIRTHDLGVAA
jgi:DNA polymerase III subunit chi